MECFPKVCFIGIKINQSLPIPKSNPGEVIKEDPFHKESYMYRNSKGPSLESLFNEDKQD